MCKYENNRRGGVFFAKRFVSTGYSFPSFHPQKLIDTHKLEHVQKESLPNGLDSRFRYFFQYFTIFFTQHPFTFIICIAKGGTNSISRAESHRARWALARSCHEGACRAGGNEGKSSNRQSHDFRCKLIFYPWPIDDHSASAPQMSPVHAGSARSFTAPFQLDKNGPFAG